jgi:eukaryotic-like serine/threonine-protein kinase
MELDRWEQIERLYHAALECAPEAREAFLDEACAGDEDLRREVAGLLACDVRGSLCHAMANNSLCHAASRAAR